MTDPSCPELQIGLRRDFGYSSGSGKIQGSFTISASGPQDLSRVIFYLDKNPLGDIAQPPFSLRFSTDSYSLGEHTFSALGYTSSGCRLDSNSIRAVFVTAKEGWDAGLKILVPVLSLVVGVTLLMVAATVFSSGLTSKKLPRPAAGRRAELWFGGRSDLSALQTTLRTPYPVSEFAGWQIGTLPVLREGGNCSGAVDDGAAGSRSCRADGSRSSG